MQKSLLESYFLWWEVFNWTIRGRDACELRGCRFKTCFLQCWYYNIHQPELLYTPQLHTALNFVHEECTKVNNGKFLFSGGRHKLNYHVPCWNVNQIILQLSNVDWCMIVRWILWPTICTVGESEIDGGWPVLESKFKTNILKTNSPKHTRKD